MGKNTECTSRRDILNSSNASQEKLVELGRKYVESGHLSDAVDLMMKAEDKAELERIQAKALEDGDYFIFKRAIKALGVKADRADLEHLAANAARLGKNTHAARARTELGETDHQA